MRERERGLAGKRLNRPTTTTKSSNLRMAVADVGSAVDAVEVLHPLGVEHVLLAGPNVIKPF